MPIDKQKAFRTLPFLRTYLRVDLTGLSCVLGVTEEVVLAWLKRAACIVAMVADMARATCGSGSIFMRGPPWIPTVW
jgi:hypothetical protein